ncbi:hypothetical protein Rmag_0264 [Candidatus Ruthia magnifica str. Cm (Calyptogena magnifica)]|uniref:DUF3108 domain-containing protein n=1 Tax=Ruthia magnifica subsp. Calyptogena magnifica TaxID=413404 RepID=A1AVT9_RUTMC|nr:DUF3108 domain-containing protein [Candidatus Ruthturnera calyptogenae]ABL02046.1 hypothetical protein Rmag_0264 [Candidatus Ruthia magnifica str. Cm (Calyptogena magnifica)]
MKLLTLIIFTILINSTAHALKAHTANYKLSINGFKIAEEVRTLYKLDKHYFYTANARTSGLAAFIKDYSIAASSIFSSNPQGVDAIHYQIIEKEDGKLVKNYDIDIHSKNHSIMPILTKTQSKIRTWHSKSGNIVDPLSLFLALSNDLKHNPNQSIFTYQVTNGKSIEQHQYKRTNGHFLKINNQSIKAIKVNRINANNSNIKAYFLPKYQYLPVLIEQNKGNKRYTYTLTDLQIKNEVKDKLQVSF